MLNATTPSWWNRELTLKCKLKCYVKPMKDPLGVSPSKGNQGTTWGKEKFLLTSVGIEPTTSGLDLPLLCRLSWESRGQFRWWIAAKRKYGYIWMLCRVALLTQMVEQVVSIVLHGTTFKFKVCLVTKPLGVFSSETKWLNASLLFLRMSYVKNV